MTERQNMKKRIKRISLVLTLALFIGCTPRLKVPNIPKIPDITNSITLPKIAIPAKYLENIKLNIKVVL